MLKASALCAISSSEKETTVNQDVLSPHFSQNLSVLPQEARNAVPESVISLAHRMMQHDEVFKDVLNELRSLFASRREDFHISLGDRSQSERDIILGLFQDMTGVTSALHYCPDCGTLNGKLVLSTKVQKFLTGQYLELALYREANDLLKGLSEKYDRPYHLYRNVEAVSGDGSLKNEFDLVIEFDGVIYVIEVKSGRNFRDFDKYTKIGQEYGVVPDRFMLVDNCLSTDQADTAQYFCDYYVTNLQNGNFASKLTMMIEHDM